MALAVVLLGAGCSRTAVRYELEAGPEPEKHAERCNLRDDDRDDKVDENFRSDAGLYVHESHCGNCNTACAAANEHEHGVTCKVVDDIPRCVATACDTGYAPSSEGRCLLIAESLCGTCAQDTDCGGLAGVRCVSIGGESRCTIPCASGCPEGFTCDTRGLCIPAGGSCSCVPGQTFDLSCAADDGRDAGAPVCVGHAHCADGVLSACLTADEICDEVDNDCDGKIDEDFRNDLGGYDSMEHCGQCGVSCNEDTGLQLKLVCGGDPFAPSCVLSCPDALDGVSIGDMLDGDRDVTNGCECRVSSLNDTPGPVNGDGPLLDVDCDGADGTVRSSLYVAPDGNDAWPGSPTRPMRTINAAIKAAVASRDDASPRAHVFVASGNYTETIQLQDGVQVHGGYRRDFRALDPQAYLVDVRAPSPAQGPGGAALVAIDVGQHETRVEWLTLHGLDAAGPGQPTLGIYLERPERNLSLRDLVIHTGIPGLGEPGSDGSAGQAPTAGAIAGDEPRGALENIAHDCRPIAANTVRGGAGGKNQCSSVDASGGQGGSPACPAAAQPQPSGISGRNGGGAGGSGGEDAAGPITGADCPTSVCCGLADFRVSNTFSGPQPGGNGSDGTGGSAGRACSERHGTFSSAVWSGGVGGNGGSGSPGSGGGGGGAGGGVVMDYMDGLCEFVDGLGGGGGGGGAAGCGGTGGRGGTSGGPAVAILALSPQEFVLDSLVLAPTDGGRGGAGGAGGGGAQGAAGAFGGTLKPEDRTTPTLAGTFPGARGGSGGDGGSGGGGGGGCGGSSVGVWVVGSAPANLQAWRVANTYTLGKGGTGGIGGGGVSSGGNGAGGEAVNVFVQP
jgi:hypothetical protein